MEERLNYNNKVNILIFLGLKFCNNCFSCIQKEFFEHSETSNVIIEHFQQLYSHGSARPSPLRHKRKITLNYGPLFADFAYQI